MIVAVLTEGPEFEGQDHYRRCSTRPEQVAQVTPGPHQGPEASGRGRGLHRNIADYQANKAAAMLLARWRPGQLLLIDELLTLFKVTYVAALNS